MLLLTDLWCAQRNLEVRDIKEFKLHVYGKRQTSDSSWEFLKRENEQTKTAQTAWTVNNYTCPVSMDSE